MKNMHLVVFVPCELSVSRAERGDVTRAVKAALASVPYPCEVEILFTDDEGIQELNQLHREQDKPTDVLSFPLQDAGQPVPEPDSGRVCLGSVAINVSRCKAQAEEYGHAYARELCYLTVHSVLHLLGHDHETEEQKAHMREREEHIMQTLGLLRERSRTVLFGFGDAIRGIGLSLSQRNVRVHIAAVAAVSVLGVYLHVDRISWALLSLCYGLVLGLELCNTAIEALCDRVSLAPDELIRRCKDIAAGAVLAASLASVGVAAAVFAKPELWQGADPWRTALIGAFVAGASAICIFGGRR